MKHVLPLLSMIVIMLISDKNDAYQQEVSTTYLADALLISFSF